MRRIIRARCVWPVSSGPIENGAILLERALSEHSSEHSELQIAQVGKWTELREFSGGQVEDLGEVVLMPGLINAHCHLDYTDMAGKIPPPANFADWIKSILSLKAHWSYSEYAASWVHGAKMLLQSGTTTVLDVEAVPELLPESWQSTPLRLFTFLEMTGVQKRKDPAQLLEETLEIANKLPQTARKKVSLSPHALYSIPPGLLGLVAHKSRELRFPVQIHVSESREEFQMFAEAAGVLYEWLRPQREMIDCGECSPVEHLQRTGLLGPNVFAIHVNYLRPGDEAILGNSGTTVVHCPQSHAYFGHRKFAFEQLQKAGVNICLGTDSLASCRSTAGKPARLDMWSELRFFAEHHPVPPEKIIELATLNPAKGLMMHGRLGELTSGAWADLIGLDYTGKIQVRSMAETLLFDSKLRQSFIAGQRYLG